MTDRTLHIRDAIPSPTHTDAKFILSAFDSSIPHLSQIGSADQWGTTPLSQSRPGALEKTIDSIADAAHFRNTGEGDAVRVLIAEAELSPAPVTGTVTGTGKGEEGEREVLPVGAATVRKGYLPAYVREQEHLMKAINKLEQEEEKEFLYLEVLITDFTEKAKKFRKGTGAALVSYVKTWAEQMGWGAVLVDCWGGNEGRLVRYVFPISKGDDSG